MKRFLANHYCGRGNGNYRAGALFVLLPNVNEFIQAPFWLLSRYLFFCLCTCGCADAAAIPLRPTDGVRMEIAPAAVDRDVIVTSFVILAKMQWWGVK